MEDLAKYFIARMRIGSILKLSRYVIGYGIIYIVITLLTEGPHDMVLGLSSTAMLLYFFIRKVVEIYNMKKMRQSLNITLATKDNLEETIKKVKDEH